MFRKKAVEARTFELSNIGKDPLASIDKYLEATLIAENLLGSIDDDKLKELQRMFQMHKWREWIIAGIIGALIGFFLNLISKIF